MARRRSGDRVKPLPLVNIREFRVSFQKLTEPVRVIRARSSAAGRVEIIGTWIPGDTPPRLEKHWDLERK